MRFGAPAEAVTHLAWVPPDASSLVALARPYAPGVWTTLRGDPGVVLLLLRSGSVQRLAPCQFSFPDLLRCAETPELALQLLRQQPESLVDWHHPGRAQVLAQCRRYAGMAWRIAQVVPQCDPDHAWVAGLLAPLGWLALAVIYPDDMQRVLARGPQSSETHRARWGLDPAEMARRLIRRWGLPGWISAVAGHLSLSPEMARTLGADPVLFPVVQLAVHLTQQAGPALDLAPGASVAELCQSLKLDSLHAIPPAEVSPTSSVSGGEGQPSLLDYLALAIEGRRALERSGGARLEEELDQLHRELTAQRKREEERLHAQKLRSLAEFAAGAGHEINNPLAVISGQAQYLLTHEEDPSRRKALETIIGQTHRIHHLLRDTMQFARPPAPDLQSIDLVRIVEEVTVAQRSYAESRKVSFRVQELAIRTLGEIRADAGQVRTALTCLVRNAIEAAGTDGWVQVRLELKSLETVDVLVEDSGSTLLPTQREHLFDPFYSGRPAGRGTGLGLPMAWSFARQQGGDVFLASQTGETTCFVLRLPVQQSVSLPRAA